MSSRERLLHAFRRQPTDRLPIHIRGVRVWDDQWVSTRHPSYEPVIRAVREYGDPVATWHPAGGIFLTNPPDLRVDRWAEETSDWTCHHTTLHTPKGPLTMMHQVSKKGFPSLTKEFYVKNKEDLERFLSIPDVPYRPDLRAYFDFERRIGDSALVMISFLNPLAYVHDLLGSELLAVWSVEERPVISRLVELFAARFHGLFQYLLEGGIRGVFGLAGQEYAGPLLMSPRDFREFCTVPERQLCDLLHRRGCLVHIHCHGPLQAILEEFLTIGSDCLHPIEPPPMGDMPLAEAKRRIGHRICLEGNIQIGELYACAPAQIRKKVKQAITEGAPGGGFILCPSASPFTPTLSPNVVENYLTLIHTGREIGR